MEVNETTQTATTAVKEAAGSIIEVRGLKKHFPVKQSPFASTEWLRAVDGIDFKVGRDTVLALVGESGCGKSTVAKLLLKLLEPTSGEVLFRGKDIVPLHGDELKAFRRAVQIIFQDPFASLNPRRNVYNTLSEPMKIHGLVEPELFEIKVIELLAKVGLGDVLERFPHEFSGGQRQRICIARALAVSPELIVADEPLSALDVSIQAQILNLLQELRRDIGISFVFISHDLRVVEYFSDEVGVMYLGRIVEQAPSEELFAEPRHPYTEVLLASAPGLTPGAKRKAIGGEVPSPIHIPSGCAFHPRCPKKFDPCDKIVPALASESGRPVACHLWNSY